MMVRFHLRPLRRHRRHFGKFTEPTVSAVGNQSCIDLFLRHAITLTFFTLLGVAPFWEDQQFFSGDSDIRVSVESDAASVGACLDHGESDGRSTDGSQDDSFAFFSREYQSHRSVLRVKEIFGFQTLL
jgi:hypothetical protein